MEIDGKCRREYKLTLDGESFEVVMKALGWAIYHKEDTIKRVKREKHAGVLQLVGAHTKDWENIRKIQDKLVALR